MKPVDNSVLFSFQQTFGQSPVGPEPSTNCRASKGPSSKHMTEKAKKVTEGWIQKGLGQEGLVRVSGCFELHQSPGLRSDRDTRKPLRMEVAMGNRQLNQEWGLGDGDQRRKE